MLNLYKSACVSKLWPGRMRAMAAAAVDAGRGSDGRGGLDRRSRSEPRRNMVNTESQKMISSPRLRPYVDRPG